MNQISHELNIRSRSKAAKRSKVVVVSLIAVAFFLVLSISIQETDADQGDEGLLSVDYARYDSDTHIVSYSGTSDQELVNIRIIGSEYFSQITAENVSSGHYSGSIKLNLSGPAVYEVHANAGGIASSRQFVVTGTDIQFAILLVTYDPIAGLVNYAGISASDLVNVRLIGDNFSSPVAAELTDNGVFSGSLYVGSLTDGVYNLRIIDGDGELLSRQISVGHAETTITSVNYDPDSGIISYTGVSDSDLVNLRVYGHEFVSQVNAELVKSESFSGSMNVGSLDVGVYRIVVKAGDSFDERSFTVDTVADAIKITDLYVDYNTWTIQFEGSSKLKQLSGHIEGNGVSTTSVSQDVVSDAFEGTISIDGFAPGLYSLVLTGDGFSTTKNFTVVTEDDEITDLAGNVMTEYGKVLVRFSGTSDEYMLPENVEHIRNNAFYGATISKFVYDRDREWDTAVNGRYPFEGCGIATLEIREGVSEIPDYLFAKLSITSLSIPSSVERIGVKSFYACLNLTNISISDNSKISVIDSYAFGGVFRGLESSSSIEAVTFGSSADGYCCEVGMGAFLLCDSLTTVSLHEGFNLKTIGNLAFAKKSTASEIQAIAFNCNNGILIPKEVEEVGWMAFSTVDPSHCSTFGEPGANTYKYQTPQIYPNPTKMVVGTDWLIGFEEGSVINTINEAAFAGNFGVKTIDLSRCSGLKVIKDSAFRDCLADGGTINISDSVEELYKAFSRSSGKGYLDITIPSSVKICRDSFTNLSRSVSTGENSELIEYAGSLSDISTDLTRCARLESVTGSGNVILSPGVYNLRDNTYDSSMKVATCDYQFEIILTTDTNVISWSDIKSVKTVSYSIDYNSDQAYVKEKNNVLYFCKADRNIVLKNLEGNNPILCPDALLMDRSLDGDIVGIELNEGASISSGAFRNCTELETIRIHFIPEDVSDLIEAIAEAKLKPSIYIDGFISESMVKELNKWATVYQGYEAISGWIYLNSSIDGSALCYTKNTDGSIRISSELDLSRYVLEVKGCVASLKNGVITIASVESGAPDRAIDVVLDPIYKKYVTLKLDYNGGTGPSGETSSEIKVRMGSVFKDAIMPVIWYDCHTLMGWTMADGSVISDNYEIEGNLSLYAKWTQRSPGVFIECSCADVYSGNSIFTGLIVQSGSSITLTCVPHAGYELLNWILNGEESVSADSPLVIQGIEGDKHISISYRYVSPSSGIIAVSDRGLPTITESESLVEVSELGGSIDMSGMIWKGHDSVPLIVDDYVYFRAGDRIYKAESDTGYVVASAPSIECEAFYHQIAYGDGIIVDSLTGKAYNLDLEQIFVLDRTFEGIDYYKGNFYSSGQVVYRFSSEDEVAGPSEVKKTYLIGKMDHVFSSYGFSNSVFVDHYLYRVYAEGALRGIVALDLDSQSGETVTYAFRSMDYMYLDDGWISYNDGYIYLPGYTSGLFGAQAKTGYSGIAFVKVDGLSFHSETEGYYEFNGKTGFTSEMLFWNDKAYIVVHDTLYAFDIVNHTINPNSVRTTSAVGGHGSIAMDTSHSGEIGSPVYIYQIPYFSTAVKAMGLIEDKGGVLTTVIVGGLQENYNSQVIRPDIDGRMVWYNDSGHIFTYTTPEKNVYYFFIDDGSNAGWYRAYGANTYEAALTLSDVISISDVYEISRMYGKQVTNVTITAVHSPANSIMQYDWSSVDSLNNRGFDTDHYIIIAAGDANVQKDSVYTYWDGSAFKTYSFKENIGDRSLIGVQMVPGNSASMVQFFEGDEEIDDSYILGIVGSDVLGDFPRVHKDGYLPVWKDSSGNEVTSLEGTKFVSGGTVYKLSWEKIHSYGISVTKTEVKDNTLKLEYTIETTDESGLNIQVQAAYSDMTFVREPIEAKIAEDGKITLVYTNTGESAPVKALVTAYKGNILVLAEYIDLTESGSS